MRSVAAACGISYVMMLRYSAGTGAPKMRRALRLARELDCGMDDLWPDMHDGDDRRPAERKMSPITAR